VRSSPDVTLAEGKSLETYEKMLRSYLMKINNPKTSWQELYAIEKNYTDPSMKIELSNRERERRRELQSIALKKKLEGSQWSDKFSEQEMRDWIEKYGAISEEMTRGEIDKYSLKGGVHLSVGFNLANNELASDFENTRKLKTSFEVAYESFLFRRASSYIRNFSLDFSMRYSLDGVSGAAANALTTEVSMAAKFLWYPVAPYRMNKNIFFFGTGARIGLATLEVARTLESGKYNVLGLGILAGYRYNFMSGWGFRVLMNLESLSFKSSSRSEPIVHLKSSIGALEARFQLGLSYVF
jgi:hypothetical protein